MMGCTKETIRDELLSESIRAMLQQTLREGFRELLPEVVREVVHDVLPEVSRVAHGLLKVVLFFLVVLCGFHQHLLDSGPH